MCLRRLRRLKDVCKWLTKDRTKTYCGMNAVYVQYRLQVHIRTACNKKKKQRAFEDDNAANWTAFGT